MSSVADRPFLWKWASYSMVPWTVSLLGPAGIPGTPKGQKSVVFAPALHPKTFCLTFSLVPLEELVLTLLRCGPDRSEIGALARAVGLHCRIPREYPGVLGQHVPIHRRRIALQKNYEPKPCLRSSCLALALEPYPQIQSTGIIDITERYPAFSCLSSVGN